MSATAISQSFGRLFATATRVLAPSLRNPKEYTSRFDVVQHGIELPDVAQFPEFAGIAVYPSDTQIERELHGSFQRALSECNSELFMRSMDDLDRAIEQFAAFSAEQREIKERQLNNTRSIGRWYINYKNEWKGIDRSDLKSNRAHAALKNDGVHSCHIGTARLNELLEAEISELLGKEVSDVCRPGEGYDRSKMFFNDAEHEELFGVLRLEMNQQGILSAAAKHHNCRDLDFKHACLHICTPQDTHFTQTLQDCQTTSKLIGLHIDPKPVMKIIVYLNEVTASTGPFSFVPGSHRWRFDEVELLFAKGNSTGNYLHSPQHRWVAAKFPPLFRKNSIVGRFVLDGTKASEKLLGAEKMFTSKTGNCILFDPGNGLHRGGICTSGNRINLQIVLH